MAGSYDGGNTKVAVVSVQYQSNAVDGIPVWTVSAVRVSGSAPVSQLVPDVADIPEDVRNGILRWLTGENA